MEADARRRFGASVLAALRAIAGPTLPLPPSAALRCCPDCGRDRVTVIERTQHSGCLDLLRVRCGECELARDVVATRSESAALLAHHRAQRRSIENALAVLDDDRVDRAVAAFLAPEREEST